MGRGDNERHEERKRKKEGVKCGWKQKYGVKCTRKNRKKRRIWNYVRNWRRVSERGLVRGDKRIQNEREE